MLTGDRRAGASPPAGVRLSDGLGRIREGEQEANYTEESRYPKAKHKFELEQNVSILDSNVAKSARKNCAIEIGKCATKPNPCRLRRPQLCPSIWPMSLHSRNDVRGSKRPQEPRKQGRDDGNHRPMHLAP